MLPMFKVNGENIRTTSIDKQQFPYIFVSLVTLNN